jgi:uncharacterized protein (TIGR01244 family)
MQTLQPIRKINDELAIAGQITSAQLHQLAQDGYRTVLNLRSPGEANFSASESSEVEALGLQYVNTPIGLDAIAPDDLNQALEAIVGAKKPALVHCSNGAIAAALVLMHIAIRQGADLEQAFKQAKSLGLFSMVNT